MADESKLDILGKISGLQPGESGELLLEDIGPEPMHLFAIHQDIIN